MCDYTHRHCDLGVEDLSRGLERKDVAVMLLYPANTQQSCGRRRNLKYEMLHDSAVSTITDCSLVQLALKFSTVY